MACASSIPTSQSSQSGVCWITELCITPKLHLHDLLTSGLKRAIAQRPLAVRYIIHCLHSAEWGSVRICMRLAVFSTSQCMRDIRDGSMTSKCENCAPQHLPLSSPGPHGNPTPRRVPFRLTFEQLDELFPEHPAERTLSAKPLLCNSQHLPLPLWSQNVEVMSTSQLVGRLPVRSVCYRIPSRFVRMAACAEAKHSVPKTFVSSEENTDPEVKSYQAHQETAARISTAEEVRS